MIKFLEQLNWTALTQGGVRADLGEWGGVFGRTLFPSSGIWPSRQPKGHLFGIIYDIYFRPTSPRYFLKAPLVPAGADLAFSRGGGQIFKKFEKVLSFFKVNQIDFSSSPKALKKSCFCQIFCAAGKIFKKQAIFRQILGIWWKIWP